MYDPEMKAPGKEIAEAPWMKGRGSYKVLRTKMMISCTYPGKKMDKNDIFSAYNKLGKIFDKRCREIIYFNFLQKCLIKISFYE